MQTRSISDCTVHLEASGPQIGKDEREACIFLADFAAASFPSGAWDWFEFVCTRMGVTRELQNILGYFTTHWVSDGGVSGYGWAACSWFPRRRSSEPMGIHRGEL
eukprot:6138630-Amphidinium_carterae.2